MQKVRIQCEVEEGVGLFFGDKTGGQLCAGRGSCHSTAYRMCRCLSFLSITGEPTVFGRLAHFTGSLSDGPARSDRTRYLGKRLIM